VGVKVDYRKRLVATTFVAIFAMVISGLTTAQASDLRDTKSSHPSASPKPTPLRTVSKQAMPKGMAMPLTASADQPVTGCAKTNAVAHYPIKVGTPDPRVAQVDHVFTLNTNCGSITFTAFGKKAPVTVIAMAFLAKAGFFDHSLCHRITTANFYVLQCGDPTASGKGGPMWSYRDENLPADAPNDYPAGTIAMANSGPDTDASQFFIVYKDTYLPPSYTIWGQVTSGLDIIKRVAAAGVVGGGTDGTPVQKIAIETVSVK
jgi:peptidyl-prolyl cis-trans isomerase B (cyclophilin B)